MHAFDPNDYRKRVLAAVERRGGPEHSDPFELYDIPLDEAETLSDAEVSARVDEVWGFWQKQRDHPKYRVLVGLLVESHDRLSYLLLNASARGAEALRIRQERELRDAERYEMLDTAISRLVQRHGGIPAAKVAGLEEIGAMGGLTAAEIAARLRRHRVIQEAPAPAASAPATVLTDQRRKQIKQLLGEWERLVDGPPAPTLLGLLGLDPTRATHTGEIRLRAEALRARARELPAGRMRAVLDELLVHVQDLLEPGGAVVAEYVAAIREDVAAELRPKVRAAVLVEDELVGEDYEFLRDEAIELGLDHAGAVALLAELAADLGARVGEPTGPNSFSQGAAASGSHSHAPAPASGSYSQTPGARSRTPAPGPGSHSRTPAPGPGSYSRSPAAGSPAPSRRQWEEPLKEARAALRAGRAQEAARHIARARQFDPAGDGATPIRSVSDEVERVLSEAATHWRVALAAVAAKRYVEALDRLGQLRRTAADVPPPNGSASGLDQLIADAERAVAEVDRLVAAADSGPAADRSRTLLAARDMCVDHPGVLEALAATPLASPGAVRASRLPSGSVEIRWEPSSTAGVSYRVTRLQPDGSWKVVGRTRTTDIEDGGAPAGELAVYAVAAADSGRYSEAVRSDAPRSPSVNESSAPGIGAVGGATASAGASSAQPRYVAPASGSATAGNAATGEDVASAWTATTSEHGATAPTSGPDVSAAAVDPTVRGSEPVAGSATGTGPTTAPGGQERVADAPNAGGAKKIDYRRPPRAARATAPAPTPSASTVETHVPSADPAQRELPSAGAESSAEHSVAEGSEPGYEQVRAASIPNPGDAATGAVAGHSGGRLDESGEASAASATAAAPAETVRFPAGSVPQRDPSAGAESPSGSPGDVAPARAAAPQGDPSSGTGSSAGAPTASPPAAAGAVLPQDSQSPDTAEPSAMSAAAATTSNHAAPQGDPMPDGIPVVSALRENGGLLQFDWPTGVTEVMVVARPDAPPLTPDDPQARAWKVTNMRYEIDGGVRVPADLPRPCHVAVASCRREPNGRLIVAGGFAPTTHILWPHP
ncbi:hypothetical protein IU433_19210 [Nocardia puris]|uniref:hypothetical protein n=1 Tax=Nocardia puris TaxID=208602 RepID=UPI00189339B7|nr:hypothetical protein [Nocardia puris]MBF6212577.1 hypothetical protein [Nocardia puris]MBF6369157.1 hypothetical protein [Nocardia puris]MBF6461166.1 hypothetical protein [Nocardia puris]